MEIVLFSLSAYILFKMCTMTDRIEKTVKKVCQLDTDLHQKE